MIEPANSPSFPSPITHHPSPTIIRPPQTDDERAAFFRLAAAQFMRGAPPEIAWADFQRYAHHLPDADPGMVRGAFRGDDYLGGYLIEERWLRIGAGRLRAGCVGVVVTDPAHRGQGIGKALMRDSFAHARVRGQTLLLLHGLADYYRPFGYADVFDATEHAVSRTAILDAPPSTYRVREATAADAAALLDLYDRHYGPHPGSFARSFAQQAYLVAFSASLDRAAYRQRDGTPFIPPVVAVADDDQVRGYLVAPWGPLQAFGSEVAADDWPATLALLHHHARLLDALDPPPQHVRWPLPPDSLAAMLLADHVIVERTSRSRPWANWEAAIVDPLAVLETMIPVWQERWQRQGTGQSSTLQLTVDGISKHVNLSSHAGTRAAPRGEVLAVSLTCPVLAPLLFGFRSVAWATLQDGQVIPPESLPLLETLFPPQTPWIAPTDGC